MEVEDMHQRGGTDIFKEMSIKKESPWGICSRGGGLNGDEDKEVRIPYLCFDAKCYMLHCTLSRAVGWTVHTAESLIRRVSFMPFIDINPTEYRGRFATKGLSRPPRWDVSASPQSPITQCCNTGKHQGASALVMFYFSSLHRWKVHKDAENSTNTSLLVY